MIRIARSFLSAVVVSAGFLAGPLGSSAAVAGEAKAAVPANHVIGQFQASLLETMKKAKFMSVEDRFNAMVPYFDRTFYLPVMVRLATGKFWKGSEPQDQKAFSEAFRRYNVAYTASLLYTYSGQTFEFVRERPGPQGTTLVDTRLKEPDGSLVKISYVMKQYKGDWRAIDVVLDEGISEMKLRNSEYRAVLKKKVRGTGCDARFQG